MSPKLSPKPSSKTSPEMGPETSLGPSPEVARGTRAACVARASRPAARRARPFAAVLALVLALSAVLACALAPAPALASSGCTLEVHAEYDGRPLAGMRFSLWKVGEWDGRGGLELSDAWAASGVSLEGLQAASEWRAAAEKLAALAADEGTAADAAQSSSADGELVFGRLDEALYLVVSDGLESSSGTYACAPQLVSIPSAGTDDVVIEPKVGFTGASGSDSGNASGSVLAEDSGAGTASEADSAGRSGSGPLSSTGDVAAPATAVGLALVAAGAIALASRRKRRQEPTSGD